MNFISRIPHYKTIALLVIAVGLYYVKNNIDSDLHRSLRSNSYDRGVSVGGFAGAPALESSQKMVSDSYIPPAPDVAPSTSANRLKSYTASLSMVVKDVYSSLKAIEATVANAGGFLINSYISSPEEGAYGTVSLRVPRSELSKTLEAIKAIGVRVTQESVSSSDLTDEYENIDAKLTSLQSTMTKFEALLNQANTVEESMRVQEQLLNLQDRIDGLVGRKQYLEKSSELSLITITIASDELSLPYAPQDTWRPQLIFKQAVRSLVQSARTLVNYSIWLGVYAVIWIPLLLIMILIASRRKKKTDNDRS